MDEPKNDHKVGKGQWKKWSVFASHIFNATYEFSLLNQRLMLHPKATPHTDEHWKTVAWNHSWIAADSVREIEKYRGRTKTER